MYPPLFFAAAAPINETMERLGGWIERISLTMAGKRSPWGKPTGDNDVKLGAAYLSYGDPAKAIEAIQRGIAKGGVKNPDDAALLLGIAQLRAGNKPEAAKAFQTVSKDPTMTRIAKLWLLDT